MISYSNILSWKPRLNSIMESSLCSIDRIHYGFQLTNLEMIGNYQPCHDKLFKTIDDTVPE